MTARVTDKRRAWFRRTGAPALAHLLEIDFDTRARHPRRAGPERRAGGARGRIGRRALVSPPVMSDHVYKSVEITGSSPRRRPAGDRQRAGQGRQTLRNIDWFEVVGIRGGFGDGATYYQVTLKIGFRLED